MFYNILELIMNGCYTISGNYGLAIILFTFISKVALLPVAVWVQKNAIKMVKMQPEINFIKAKHYGDHAVIDEELSKIYKREKYNPFLSVIPVVIQIALLAGVIAVIKGGINHPAVNMFFLKIDLSLIPAENKGILQVSPIIAGFSAWLLCMVQNRSNVLQSEQSNANKYAVMVISVGLSLYLGWFVPVGVVLYWVCSNFMAVIQLYFLNWCMNPGKYVDYEKLEESKKALDAFNQIGKEKQRGQSGEERKREKNDYKRFFSVVNKHLVFYSESSGFYKYYKGIIEYLLANTNLTIHYITGDPDDLIFEKARMNDKIRAYYINEKKLITLMMKMNADIVVMTMPDLENFHIKRSYVRKDIEYIFIPHGIGSINLMMRKGSIDHYDTIFCLDKYQKEEIIAWEQANGLQRKELVECGCCLIDEMRADYKAMDDRMEDQIRILIAPSWQQDNIMDSCIEEILERLKNTDYYITVRPHPQHIRHKKQKIDKIIQSYKDYKNICVQTDFSSNRTIFEADLVITDWSGIAYEYAYATQKPVLFINTPMKVMNPDYKRIGIVPLNIRLREQIGCSLDVEQLHMLNDKITMLIDSKADYYDIIGKFISESVYHVGNSAQIGADYLIRQLQKKAQERKNKDT